MEKYKSKFKEVMSKETSNKISALYSQLETYFKIDAHKNNYLARQMKSVEDNFITLDYMEDLPGVGVAIGKDNPLYDDFIKNSEFAKNKQIYKIIKVNSILPNRVSVWVKIK